MPGAAAWRGRSQPRARDPAIEHRAGVAGNLHQGKAAIALALGAFDGDPAAGRVAMRGDTLSGKASFVEGAQTATHLLIFTDRPAGVAVVAGDAAGLTVQATPGLAVPPFAEIAFENTPAVRLDVPSETLADVALVARLACPAGRSARPSAPSTSPSITPRSESNSAS